jgi:hypothetical protein
MTIYIGILVATNNAHLNLPSSELLPRCRLMMEAFKKKRARENNWYQGEKIDYFDSYLYSQGYAPTLPYSTSKEIQRQHLSPRRNPWSSCHHITLPVRSPDPFMI